MTPLVDENKLAEMISMSVWTLRRWRVVGEGTRFVKIGSSVRYDIDDVKAWLEQVKRDVAA